MTSVLLLRASHESAVNRKMAPLTLILLLLLLSNTITSSAAALDKRLQQRLLSPQFAS